MEQVLLVFKALVALPKILDKLEKYFALLDQVVEAKQIIDRAEKYAAALLKAGETHDTSDLENMYRNRSPK